MSIYPALVVALSLAAVTLVNTEHLNVGSSVNNQLAHIENVKLSVIPLKIRTKNIFYNNGTHPKVIKGITAVDYLNSKSKVTITAGGVGATFTNIKLKSARGEALDYQIQIFV